MQKSSSLALLLLLLWTTGAIAMEKPLLTLSKKTAPPKETAIADQVVISPAYDFGEIVVHNRFAEPIALEWTIGADQNFIPIVRTEAGEIVSNGHMFGFARSPSGEVSERTVAPGKETTIEARMLFETVPEDKQKPGAYFIRVQYAAGDSIWESNEIKVELKD